MPIDALIDKEDNFEIVRDQIAAILVLESDSQRALAKAANKKNPKLWKLRVFTERSNPIEEWRDVNSTSTIDDSPIVNVWYDNGSFPMGKGNPIEKQVAGSVYNIDCYGVGFSGDNPAGGHFLGDKESAIEVQRAIRLVRNIIMNPLYAYLALTRGIVGLRWPQNITVFPPQIDGRPVAHVTGARIALRVDHIETVAQPTAVTLEELNVDVKRTEDGEIVLAANYNYT